VWWQGVVGKDWVLKIVSLGFAIMLWFFVVGEEKAEVSLSIPLEIVNLPSNLVIANDIPPAIDVRVYGPRSMIKAIASQGLSKVIDLKGAIKGKVTIQITPESLPLPGGVRVMRIQPSHIDIILEQLKRTLIPVKPVVEGRPAKDYIVEKVECDPPSVILAGPASEIDTIKEIKTLPINIEGASDDVITDVGLDLHGLHVTIDGRGVVEVLVKITQLISSKKVTHVPVHVEATFSGVSWWPQVISVKVRGWSRTLRSLTPEKIKVIVRAKDLSPGLHKVTPTVKLPNGLKVVEIVPKQIRVKIPRE